MKVRNQRENLLRTNELPLLLELDDLHAQQAAAAAAANAEGISKSLFDLNCETAEMTFDSKIQNLYSKIQPMNETFNEFDEDLKESYIELSEMLPYCKNELALERYERYILALRKLRKSLTHAKNLIYNIAILYNKGIQDDNGE